ncbi:MAG: hypothetical protein K8S56_06420 [Candidatus Cloacimonetes bacterium]|nr:hypothetical protein [Candidatus Cloacimonadota bacterium]
MKTTIFALLLLSVLGLLPSLTPDDLLGKWESVFGGDTLYVDFKSDSMLVFDDEQLTYSLQNNAIHINEIFGSTTYPLSIEGEMLYIDFVNEGYKLQFRHITPKVGRSYQPTLEWRPASIKPFPRMGVNTWSNPGKKKLELQKGLRVKETVFLKRVHDHNYAFWILKPEMWIFEGGSYTNNLAGNHREPRIHIQIKNNEDARIAIHMYPGINYFIPAGMLPVGSEFQGGYLMYRLSPLEYLSEIILRNERPNAKNVHLVREIQLDELAQSLEESTDSYEISYQAAVGMFEYEEHGIRYLESGYVMILSAQDYWTNLFTVTMRAPADSFTNWEPVLDAVLKSLKPNPLWIKSVMDDWRVNYGSQQEGGESGNISWFDFDSKWTGNENVTPEWDIFLSNSVDYINPFTKEIEKVPAWWSFRWQHSNGDVVLTGDNSVIFVEDLKARGYKRSVKRIIIEEAGGK